MKRKVIKQGHNTLTITLPKVWVNEQSIQAGSEIEVTNHGDHLKISNLQTTRAKETVSSDVSNLDRTSIILLIQAFYRFGYDTINIQTNKIKSVHHRKNCDVTVSYVIHNTINRLIGSELISSTSTSFSIKKITEESKDEFDTVLRRIFLLLKEEMNVFIKGIKNKDSEVLQTIEFHHINIKKFINFCLRLLNKFGHDDDKKSSFYFSLILYLSKIEDFIKNASRYITKSKLHLTPKSVEVIKQISQVMDQFYELFYSFDLKKVEAFIKSREDIRIDFFKELNQFSKHDLIIIGGLLQIPELILDMAELRIALEN